MMELPFQHIRVVDCAHDLAGSLAAMMLGQLGAEVIKVEPPGGDARRGTPAFAALNQGKRSIALDSENDTELWSTLTGGSDVLIQDGSVDSTAHASHLITCCIRPAPADFGLKLPPDDLLVMAAVGLLNEQPATRREGPAFIQLPFGSYCAGWLAATGIAARLVSRLRGGVPGPVDTSLLQGALLPSMMLWRDVDMPTPGLVGRIDKRMLPSIFECADGVWLHIMKNADDTPLMRRLLDEMGPQVVAEENAKWPPHFRYGNWGANVRAFKSRPSAEWLADLWASDVPAQPAQRLGELYGDTQAEANRYVVEIDDPQLGPIRIPGAPVTIEPEARIGTPMAAADADRASILEPRRPAAFPAPSKPAGTPLLEGVRVVDFGNYLAGPLATMLLADLGAQVIKVEPPQGDPMRANESAFLGCHRGKRSIALDLRVPEARTVIERLVRGADIVHHNIRLPTATKLGLSWDALKAINSEVVFGHVSAYGPAGERRYWPGYDQLFQASAGWELAHAGKGNRPAWLRFGMMDHMCAASLAFAMLAAFYRRLRTGEGSQVAASLLGTSIWTMSDVAMTRDGALIGSPAPMDADQTGALPGRCLARCSDGWIAFSGPDGSAPGSGTLSPLTCDEALERLAHQGFAAVRIPVEGALDFLRSPDRARLRHVAHYPHPVYGEVRHPGAFWNLGDASAAPRSAPPTFDQHRDEILAELGFGSAEIERLQQAGVVGAGTAQRVNA